MTQRRMGSFFVSLSRLYQASCLLRLRMASPRQPQQAPGSRRRFRDQIRRHGSLMKYSKTIFPYGQLLNVRGG